MWKSFALELHGEWSEFAHECISPSSHQLRTELANPRKFLKSTKLTSLCLAHLRLEKV